MTEAELNIRYGYAWRAKVAEQADDILAVWGRLSPWKRTVARLRGQSPGTREELIARIEGELLS